MKKTQILSILTLCLFLSACSFNEQAKPAINKNKFELKKDRDYLAISSRNNILYLIDSKQDKVVHSCKLKGTYGPGALVISPDGTKAYTLQDKFQAIYGYDLQTCENFFKASFNEGSARGIAMFSINISKDGKEIYTIYTPARKNIDSYDILDPVFAVFNPDDGLNAKAIRSFKAPRQTTIMMTSYSGNVYVLGSNIYKINPKNGEIKIAAKLREWDRVNYSQPDAFAMWPIGNVSNEFLTMYSAAKFNDKEQSMENAQFVWGATRIDLKTDEVVQEDFANFETIMFTGITHPKDSNLLYGALTDLTKFDRKNKKVLKRVLLEHTYYCLNFATDGSRLYIGGTLNDIAVYDPENLEQLGKIMLPAGDTGASTLQVFRVR